MGIRTVLLVDDEKAFSEIVKMNLELSEKFEVHTAASGKEGLRLAREVQPHVILLDINMPKMDGFEVLRQLKKHPETIKIPVIMLSARSEDAAKIQASEAYAEYYITKPIGADELIEKIEWVLDKAKR